jgi:uncharacterized OB-fold protein
MISCVEGVEPDAVHIGMPVQAKIVYRNDAPLLVFEPA